VATARNRSLVEKGGRKAFVRDKGLAHTAKEKYVRKKLISTQLSAFSTVRIAM